MGFQCRVKFGDGDSEVGAVRGHSTSTQLSNEFLRRHRHWVGCPTEGSDALQHAV